MSTEVPNAQIIESTISCGFLRTLIQHYLLYGSTPLYNTIYSMAVPPYTTLSTLWQYPLSATCTIQMRATNEQCLGR